MDTNDDTPEFPFAKSFVLQFGNRGDEPEFRFAGRVEHLRTGKRIRFASFQELASFVEATVAELDRGDE